MRDLHINKIVSEIIPQDDYEHRNGFSNEHLVDKLSGEVKSKVESELIDMLQEKPDMLVVETLAYMKSTKSLPILYQLLESMNDEEMSKIITAVSIFQIDRDKKMLEIAKASFKKIKGRFQLISAFHYLKRLQNPEVSKLIQPYVIDPDYLISYNAKQALGRL